MKRFAAALVLLAVLPLAAACSGNEEDIIGNPDGTLGEEGFQKLLLIIWLRLVFILWRNRLATV